MRIFTGFLIILTGVLLWLLPVTTMVYDFRTDQRTDEFTVTTAAGQTTANVTLQVPVFDDDTQTISFSTNVTSELPIVSTYNGTSRQLLVAGLDASATRLLDVTYDYDALSTEGSAINTLLDKLPAIYMLVIIAFPVTGVALVIMGIRGV